MKTYCTSLLFLLTIVASPLFCQEIAENGNVQPHILLTSYAEAEEKQSQHDWDHISALDFFNQSDQVIEYLRENNKRTSLFPHEQLTLAKNLKKRGKYELAQQWFEKYRQYDLKKGQHFISSCKTAASLNNRWESQRIEPVSINSSESEYSPCVTRDGLVFFRMSQNRKGSAPTCNFQVFIADGEASVLDDERLLAQRFQLPENMVFMDVSPSGTKVLFTKLTDQSCFNGFLTTEGMATYEAEVLSNGDWENIRPLPFNTVGQRTAYATYGESDDKIYFASDISSGFGGFDVYRAERLQNNTWSTPQNLGPNVNSEGNEITPKFNGEVLSFASDYHEGLGGYDIFYSPIDQSEFLQPVNAGRPLNSPMDDWGLSFVDQETGYFASNRANASANSNIYYFEDLVETPKPQALQVSYSSSTGMKGKAITAFPIHWSDAQMQSFFNDPETKKPIRTTYSVQIAVISPNNKSFSRLQDELGDLDDLYKIYFDEVVKIRLGSYDKEITASLMLEKIKSRGYTDAFIVTEKIIVAADKEADSPDEIISRKKPEAQTKNLEVKGEGEFLLRLATYLHPDNFDASKVDGLGDVSSIEKGPYTIFVLGSFSSLQQARRMQSEVQSRGFTNAQIIRMEDGDIVRVSLN